MILPVMDWIFETPHMLWLLLLLPIVWWAERKFNKIRPALRYSSLSLLPDTNSWRISLYRYSGWCRYIASALIILALARPVKPLQEEKIEADSIDISMVIDLSSSMLAQDFEPNRLEASKIVAKQFIDNRPYDLFSLVVFAAEAYTQSPLTTDRVLLQNLIDQMECGLLEDGTAIGMGLATAVNRLRHSDAVSKIIILLTDGVNNSGYIQPMTAAHLAKELDIKVYTVGVGSRGETLSPVSRRADGQYVYGYTRVEIDEKLLEEISQLTGGKYYRAVDNIQLEEVYDEIDQLEKTKIEITTVQTFSEMFRVFLLMGFIFLLLEIMIRRIWLYQLP